MKNFLFLRRKLSRGNGKVLDYYMNIII